MIKRLLAAVSPLLWAFVIALFVASFTVGAGITAAVFGCFAGSFAGRRLARTTMRLLAIWALGACIIAVIVLCARLVVDHNIMATLLGPRGAYLLGEVIFFFGITTVLLAVLEASSARRPLFTAVQFGLGLALVSALLAAHRYGFINRPRPLVDALWVRGWDPIPIFLAFGALAAAGLILNIMLTGTRRKSLADVVIIVVIIIIGFVLLPIGSLTNITPPQSRGSDSQGQGSGQAKDGSADPSQQGSDSGGEAIMSSLSDQQNSTSNLPVAVVVLRDDYNSPLGYYYFRQTAFSQYNGLRLIQDTSGIGDRDLFKNFPTDSEQFSIAISTSPYTREIRSTVALIVPQSRPFALTDPLSLRSIPNPDTSRFLRAYEVESRVLEALPAELEGISTGSFSWSPSLYLHYTESSTDLRYLELAEEIIGALDPGLQDLPFAQVLAIQLWLGENGIYSKNTEHENASDPLAAFLFGDRIGHCVYFAHSACLLLRSLGIPSRVGAGYAYPVRARGNGASLLLRAQDAHAWPEVYIEDLGWLVIDIAPIRSLDPPVEGPDMGLQQMLGEMARSSKGEKRPDGMTGSENLQERLRRLGHVLFTVFVWLALVMIIALYAVKLWRRVAPRWCNEADLPVIGYRAMLDQLADAGILRAYGETRTLFAERALGGNTAFEKITLIHLETAFGTRKNTLRRAQFEKLNILISDDITKLNPAWRQWLGLTNPLSWLRVK